MFYLYKNRNHTNPIDCLNIPPIARFNNAISLVGPTINVVPVSKIARHSLHITRSFICTLKLKIK